MEQKCPAGASITEAREKAGVFITQWNGLAHKNGATAMSAFTASRTREPPNAAAAQASEYLKTIVPVQGTTALHPLLYKNGSAEARSQVMHMNYFGSTVDYNEDDLDNVCPDIAEGLFAGPVTYVGGEMDPYMQNYYIQQLYRQGIW